MNLRVGICGNPSGWDVVLQQEGIPFEQAADSLDAGAYSLVILADSKDRAVIQNVRDYLSGGGSVLCSAGVFAAMTGTRVKRREVRYVIPDNVFPGNAIVDLEIEAEIPENANALPSSGGFPTVYVGKLEGGDAIVIPFDPAVLEGDERNTVRTFWANGRRLPFERVSAVWRSGARRLVARSIELLHHRRSLPFVRLWYYPRDAESVLCFRVDTDGALPADVDRLMKVTGSAGIPSSWFLDMQTQQEHLAMYTAAGDDELGLHCYSHQRYSTYQQANSDIGQGIAALLRGGVTASGFAAPYGAWNHEIARAIEERGFAYSSEFCYDYDGLPTHPLSGKRLSTALQIPAHPISIGSLRRQGFREIEMRKYFESVIASALARRNPIVLYHHPKDGYESVLAGIFGEIRRRGIKPMTMSAFERWWRHREEVVLKLTLQGTMLRVNSASLPQDVSIFITRADGTEAIVPADGEMHLDLLPWRTSPHSGVLPDGVGKARRLNPWIHIIRIEDLIYKHLRRRIWGA